MTMPATVQPLGDRLPSAQERAAANQLRRILASRERGRDQIFTISSNGSEAEIVLTPALSDLLIDMLRPLGRGDAVTLVPVSRMLTTQQAADVLNVSRPYFIAMLERGELPYETVGRHRRIRAEAVFGYKTHRDENRTRL